VDARDWNLFPWSQVAEEEFSGVAQLELRFFTHDEILKQCMMGGGGKSRSRMWIVTSAAGEACK
jgi:hypothetical protein